MELFLVLLRSPGARLDLRQPLGKRGYVSPTLPRLVASTPPIPPAAPDTASPLTRVTPGTRCDAVPARVIPHSLAFVPRH